MSACGTSRHSAACPLLEQERTFRDGGDVANDPGCVKTHTSAKCRKYNSVSRLGDAVRRCALTPEYGISPKFFYALAALRSFCTAKTHGGHVAVGGTIA